MENTWHEQIKATDNGCVKFGCGHGAEKSTPIVYLEQWCELCSNSIPKREQAKAKMLDYAHIKKCFDVEQRDKIWRSIKGQQDVAPVRF